MAFAPSSCVVKPVVGAVSMTQIMMLGHDFLPSISGIVNAIGENNALSFARRKGRYDIQVLAE